MISKSAENVKNFQKELYYFNSAREGWNAILESSNLSNKVLLPSYIGVTEREGSGIFDPIINSKVSYDFYDLNNDLSVPLDKITSKLENGEYGLVLLVHYFGFKIKNIEEIVKICKENKIIIVEDCAHLYNYNLYSYSRCGTYGDFVFYSLHKFFPMKKGGMVIKNNENINLLFSGITLDVNYSSQVIKYDVKAIADKRIENYKYLDKLIKNIEGIKPLMSLALEDIPHNYPITVNNNLREKLYFWMIEKNITLIALYYRLINPISKDKYSNTYYLSNNILNLPIHQDINKVELDNLAELLEEGLKELKK
ncbi:MULTISPECIES: DegT/DnrJ/EryC1/StrS family aminotransferase [Winogradskyella]|uniref:DegT/DnrJ/EryC1/StrS aminotransferase family protein n=1 Tax=Winogradskyella thalassocola TaxID=262004 RepID=A0A1G8FXM9_9FLAO|nr:MULTISPECIES: DegT/DnrJ/EryC1/StrS family aminotransferase [Winogradskyella]SDH86746.1 DegT/DnrJ/EryC1/StrS aminotransferase family protein [Winogradskyella thalassocola]